MFAWPVLVHVILPTRFQRSATKIDDDRAVRIKAHALPKSAIRSMLASLRRLIEGLETSLPRQGAWSDYAETNRYRVQEAASKAEFVRRFAAKVIWRLRGSSSSSKRSTPACVPCCDFVAIYFPTIGARICASQFWPERRSWRRRKLRPVVGCTCGIDGARIDPLAGWPQCLYSAWGS